MPIGSRLMIRSFQSRQVIRKRTNGTKSWKSRSSAAWRAGAKVAGRSNDPPRRGDERSDRPSLWPRRAVAPPCPPFLVPILRRGDGHGLAFLGHHNERDRRLEARLGSALE